jgi:hypothetical protein
MLIEDRGSLPDGGGLPVQCWDKICPVLRFPGTDTGADTSPVQFPFHVLSLRHISID